MWTESNYWKGSTVARLALSSLLIMLPIHHWSPIPVLTHTRSPFLPCNTCYFFYASFLAYCNMKVVKSTFHVCFPFVCADVHVLLTRKSLVFLFFAYVCMYVLHSMYIGKLEKAMLIEIIFSNIVFIDIELQLNCNLTLLGRKEIF